MLIRWKTYAVLSFAVLAALLLAVLLVGTRLSTLVENLERRDLLLDVQRADELVEQRLNMLQSLAKDWGYWDDTYEYTSTGNPDYIKTNFQPIWLDEYNIHLLAIKSKPSGNLNILTNNKSGISADQVEQLIKKIPDDNQAGLVIIEDDIFLTSVAQIKGSSGNLPSRGHVIFMQAIDEEWLHTLSKKFGASISIKPPLVSDSQPSVLLKSDQQAVVNLPLKTLNAPGYYLLMEVSDTRKFKQLVQNGLLSLGISIVLTVLLLLALIAIGMEKTLFMPLAKIRNQLLSLAGPQIIKKMMARKDWRQKDTLQTLEILMQETKRLVEDQRRLLEEQREVYRTQSLSDPLTGLLNRRGLDRSFREKGIDNTQVLCAIFDIDHFKDINDTYGHDFGDRALQAFSEILRTHSPDNAVIGRTGGEEFCLLAPVDSDLQNSVLKNLRCAIQSELGPELGLESAVTVSIGSIIAHQESSFELGDLMRLADSALYEAKETRNTWVGYYQLAPFSLAAGEFEASQLSNAEQFTRTLSNGE